MHPSVCDRVPRRPPGVSGGRGLYDEWQPAAQEEEQAEVEEAVVPPERQGALHLHKSGGEGPPCLNTSPDTHTRINSLAHSHVHTRTNACTHAFTNSLSHSPGHTRSPTHVHTHKPCLSLLHIIPSAQCVYLLKHCVRECVHGALWLPSSLLLLHYEGAPAAAQ